MSGFSPDWLALREPADHAARDAGVLAAAAAAFAGRDVVTVLDLGCGSGSNLRALSPRLGASQAWTLVDHDPALLAAARSALAGWADAAAETPDGLVLNHGGRKVTVTLLQADLVGGLDALLARGPDLVTAAALFDLVSEAWLRRFCAALAERRLPIYAALTYDGLERWLPSHPLDERILAAFHAHQGRDKGFGPAAGPRAAGTLAANLAKLGYGLRNGNSPWKLTGAPLDQQGQSLIAMLAEGIAAAAAETGRVTKADAAQWAAARSGATAVEIGHRDLLALPG